MTIEIISKPTASEVACALLAIRDRCRTGTVSDFLWMCNNVLGYELVSEEIPFHVELAKQALTVGDTLTLIPRSMLKTTIVTIAGTIAYFFKFPEHSILISSATYANSEHFLREIRQHYEINETMRTLFPEYCPLGPNEQGTKSHYDIPCSVKARKEHSIEISGSDVGMASRHYHKIILDDPVNRENVPPAATPETMAKVWEYIQSVVALLVLTYKYAHRCIIGTRWHDGDSYGQMIKNNDYDHFQKLVLSPYEHDGTSIWPEVFPLDKLDKLRRELGEYHWACLMMNDPLPPESAVSFRSDWVRDYTVEPDNLSIAITVDPAFSQNWRADRTAIAVTGIPPEGGMYVLAAEAGRWTPHEVAENVIKLANIWHPTWVGMECDSGGEAVYNVCREVIRERGEYIRLRKLKTGKQRKEARIARLSAYAQRHGIYIKPEMRQGREALANELLRYPIAEHDDYPDVLAYRAILLKTPEAPKVKPIQDIAEMNFTISGADLIKQLQRNARPGDTIYTL